MTRRWMLDEGAHAGPEHLDPAWVAGYDTKRGTDPVDDVAVLRRHGLDDTWNVLDLGAGTGAFAQQVARVCGQVIAVDVSPAMLEVLRGRVAATGAGNVRCVEAGFLSYDHDGPAVDAVYSRNALHHLPDFFKALALERIAGWLRPGGVLRLRDLIYDFSPEEAEGTVAAWLAGAAPDPLRGYSADDLVEHIRGEFSTFRWLLEPMFEAAGFEVVEVEFDRRVYGRYTCIRR
jgi:SAM-dependent methyltransferase